MADKHSVLIKYKYLEYIKNARLTDADSWVFISALIEYDKNGKEPVFTNSVLTGLFAAIKYDLDENKEKWQEVVNAKAEAGKKGAERRWGEKNQDIAKIAPAISAKENIASMTKIADLDSEFGIDSALNSCGSNELPENQPKPKKPPLKDREPENDMERVEKAYGQFWDTLYSQKKVATPEPAVSWGKTRKLLKQHFVKIKPEQIIQALKNGMEDSLVMLNAYSLSFMLTDTHLNRLINKPPSTSPPKHKIAADNIVDVRKYFKEAT